MHQAFEVKKVESEDEETDRNKWSGVNENEERGKNAKGFADRQTGIYLLGCRSPENGLANLTQELTGGLLGYFDDAFQDRPVRYGDTVAQPLQRCAGPPH